MKSNGKPNGKDQAKGKKKNKPRGYGKGWGQNLPKGPTSDKTLNSLGPGSPAFLALQRAKKTAFLEAYALRGTITGAAREAGIDRVTHLNWLRDDQEYVERFADAEYRAADLVEEVIRRRALVGVKEPIYYNGGQVGEIVRYSDTLAMFLMKKLRPAFRENAHILIGSDPANPILHKHDHKIEGLNMEEFAASFEQATGIGKKEDDAIDIQAEEEIKQITQ
mgnify:CR=1 FL=1